MSYITFYKLDSLMRGLESFKELELLDKTIIVEDTAYNTNHIVSLTSEVHRKRLVKKRVKDRSGVKWSYRRRFTSDEVE